MSEEQSTNGAVTETVVETGLAEGTPNAASDTVTETDKVEEQAADKAKGEKKVSAYKQRLIDKGIDYVYAEVKKELADMCRAAALKDGDIALSAWTRLTVAKAVNAAGLTHKVTKPAGKDEQGNDLTEEVEEPWTYDLALLEATPNRATGTRNLTPEQKKEREEKKKEEVRDERAYVKGVLEARRAALKAGKKTFSVTAEMPHVSEEGK